VQAALAAKQGRAPREAAKPPTDRRACSTVAPHTRRSACSSPRRRAPPHSTGMTGYGPQTPYCASKGALIPLAKSLALAWCAHPAAPLATRVARCLQSPSTAHTGITQHVSPRPTPAHPSQPQPTPLCPSAPPHHPIPCRAKDHINVNIVMPGAINTPFTTRVLVRGRGARSGGGGARSSGGLRCTSCFPSRAAD
jgi:NAD(P)-dependent dehydrogenase (short-subunit alcohol dehydrogenase family)